MLHVATVLALASRVLFEVWLQRLCCDGLCGYSTTKSLRVNGLCPISSIVNKIRILFLKANKRTIVRLEMN